MKSSQNFLAAALELIKKTRRSRTSIPEEWLSYSGENEDKSRARELAEEASSLEPSSSTPLNRKVIPLPSNTSKEIILEATSLSIQKIPYEQAKQTLLNKEFTLSSNSNSIEPQGDPTDTYYYVQWGLEDTEFGSNANAAWDLGITGSLSNVIGVIDTGIDYKHPDLHLNIWLNPDEIPDGVVDSNNDGIITFHDLNHSSNLSFAWDLDPIGSYGHGYVDAGDLLNNNIWIDGIDNESNGYIDDLIGWDFANDDNDPFDDNFHGTHVAGTIGALSNNQQGVAGVNWDIQLTPLKFLNADGSGSTQGAIDSINYFNDAASRHDSLFTNNGNARYLATNNSWGGGGYNSALDASIQEGAELGIIFVASAGNDARNNDLVGYYPANYQAIHNNVDHVISVASIDETGAASSFSNYGTETVDIAAPGGSIGSTSPNNRYVYSSGTSMAAPHVSGALGLLASKNSQATSTELIQALYSGADQDNNLSNISKGGKRLNITGSLDVLPQNNTIAAPTLAIAADSPTQNEGDQNSTAFSFTVTREGDLSNDSSVLWSVINDSTTDNDFLNGSPLSGEIFFTDGSASQTITVNVAGDTQVETNETFSVVLSSANNATINTASASAIIINDDQVPAPTLAIAADSPTQNEGDQNSTAFSFTVTREGDLSNDSSVLWSVINDSTTDNDFLNGSPLSGEIFFTDGSASQTITVNVAGDTQVETNETFSVVLSSANNATINTCLLYTS
ncbi:S8 family serine peptidase, partial [Synechococcus sp. WH 8020]|uniref:S8 family serine peptidase n=1 Tax=Synechococcus sp. (strain WH8020) TaxID=32052 RepID=UPI001FE101D7